MASSNSHFFSFLSTACDHGPAQRLAFLPNGTAQAYGTGNGVRHEMDALVGMYYESTNGSRKRCAYDGMKTFSS